MRGRATEDRSDAGRRVLIELAAYVGLSAGLVGTFALLALSRGLSEAQALFVAGAVTAALVIAGAAVGEDAVRGHQRLRSVLWFGALLGFSLAAGQLISLAFNGPDGISPRIASLSSGLLSAAAAAVLWWKLRRSLQQIGLYFSLLGTVWVAVLPETGSFQEPDATALAVVSWLIGAAWAALAWQGLVTPRRTALVLASVTLLLAPFGLVAPGITPGDATFTLIAIWTLATAAAVLWVGTRLEEPAVQGLGVVGLLFATAVFVGDRFTGGRGGATLALAIGLALLGGAIAAIRASRRTTAPPPPPGPASEVPAPPPI